MDRKMVDCIARGKKVFIGLEDSKQSWKLCVRRGGAIIHETSMAAKFEGLLAYLKKYVNCEIAVMYEAGFKGYTLHDRLVDEGNRCVVLPPHLLWGTKVSSVKTDKTDARKLAVLLESGVHGACRVPDRERREDRQIVRTLNAMEKDIKVTRNRIRKFLDFHGIDAGANKAQWQKEDFRRLRSVPLSPILSRALGAHLDLLDTQWKLQYELRAEFKALRKKERYAKAVKILQSFPGIGELTAIRLVLELGEALASFVGLTGREHSTGETVRRGRITAMGNNFVRSWLVESAWTSIRRDPALQQFYERVRSNTGSSKKAIVAVARKFVVRMYACMKLQTPYAFGVIQ